MIKILILVLLSYISTISYAEDKWPTKVAEVGCKFEYKGIYSDNYIVQVIDVLPFPEIRIETNRDANFKSMAELLAEAQGKILKNQKKGTTKNIFCDCIEAISLENFFPLSVGKRVVWKDHTSFNNVFEVVKYRKSPYFADTNEYLIQYSTPVDFAYYPRFGPKYRMWWNVELGFYTEKETPLHMEGYKFLSTNCPPH